MSEEILINVSPHETRVAVVENGVLQDVHIERTRKRGLVGNIIKGRVYRVLPGMQSAFIDIGLERTGFLHVSDLAETVEELESESVAGALAQNSIDTLLTERQELLVQVVKDPIGAKGKTPPPPPGAPASPPVFPSRRATWYSSPTIPSSACRRG